MRLYCVLEPKLASISDMLYQNTKIAEYHCSFLQRKRNPVKKNHLLKIQEGLVIASIIKQQITPPLNIEIDKRHCEK